MHTTIDFIFWALWLVMMIFCAIMNARNKQYVKRGRQLIADIKWTFNLFKNKRASRSVYIKDDDGLCVRDHVGNIQYVFALDKNNLPAADVRIKVAENSHGWFMAEQLKLRNGTVDVRSVNSLS